MTALIDTEYESTCAPGLAELEKDALAGALTVSVLNFNSLPIVPVACTSMGPG